MSSLSKQITEAGTRYYIQLSSGENIDRPKIHLGACTLKQARDSQMFIDDLIHCKNGHSMQDTTAKWLAGITDGLRSRLETLGLVERQEKNRWTVSAWVEHFIQSRTGSKSDTRRKLQNVQKRLNVFFKNDPIGDVTAFGAKNYRQYLENTVQLGQNTVRRHIGMCRQLFNAAIDARIIEKNPFLGQPVTVIPNKTKFFYVTSEIAQAVLQACPDAEWRLIFGLARYGGLRCPSEILGLKWQDVDFDKQRFTVHSPKTEHHIGQESRIVPLFPELRPLLQDAFDNAREGAVYCIEQYRGKETNLRTQLGRIIKKAGLKEWPKPFQNCRSTRETELFKQTGNVRAVCSWIGNSPEIALKHYAQITESDMAEAAKMTILNQAENKVQNQVQPTHETARYDAQEEKAERKIDVHNYTEKQELALAYTDLQNQDNLCPLGRGGFEPP